MELKDAINGRRSVRKFTDEVVDKEIIKNLMDAAVKAPSAMNAQPWAFSVIQNKDLLKDISDRAKVFLLGTVDTNPELERYRESFKNPNFNIFYNASTLVTIYSKFNNPFSQGDCSLAAQNVMLTAHSLGLGTCWIGFAQVFLNLPNIKEEFGVPADYTIVAPLIVGYPENKNQQIPKKDPQILFWK